MNLHCSQKCTCHLASLRVLGSSSSSLPSCTGQLWSLSRQKQVTFLLLSLCERVSNCFHMYHPAARFGLPALQPLMIQNLGNWRLPALRKCIMYSGLGTEMQAELSSLCKDWPCIFWMVAAHCSSTPWLVPLYRYTWQVTDIWSCPDCATVPEYIISGVVSGCFITSEGIRNSPVRINRQKWTVAIC